MRDAGFGKQPYLMYQHHDTKHPHIHVVTVAVDGEGNKISDRFIKNRLQKTRRRLETKYDLVQAERPVLSQVSNRVGELAGVDPKSNRQTIADVLMRTVDTYSFGSVNSLKEYLSTEGITMNTEAGRSRSGITYQHVKPEGANNRPIKASSLPDRPIHTRLTELFLDQADHHKKECSALNTLLQKRLAAYRTLTETDYKQTLRQLSIEVRETDGAYLYVNNRARVVLHEADLERGYSRQELLKRFSNKTERIPVEEVELVSQKPQNTKSQKPTLSDKVVNGAGTTQAVTPRRLTIVPTENAVIVGNTEKQTHQVERPEEITGSQGIKEQVDGQRKKKKKKNRVRKVHRI